jgi:flagellar motility protein MotE (MotC chaperone)
MNISSSLYLTPIRLFCLLFILAILHIPVTQAAEEGAQKEFQTVEERRLYDEILKENNRLQEEKKDFASKQKELKTLEEGVDKKLAEIDKKLIELRNLQKKIESLLAEKSEKELKKLQDLGKIYDKMSPDKAALALAGLDKQLAADLLAQMKVKAAAKILDQMAKQKTTELSTTFSTLKLE